jgi:hypothetical protein
MGVKCDLTLSRKNINYKSMNKKIDQENKVEVKQTV